jgi:hypothetical protein
MGGNTKVSPEEGADARGRPATAGLGQLFRYATAFDWICMLLGLIGEAWVTHMTIMFLASMHMFLP